MHACLRTDLPTYSQVDYNSFSPCTDRLTSLVMYLPFSDTRHLIFLCSCVCLPQPYLLPSSSLNTSRPVSHTHVHRQTHIPALSYGYCTHTLPLSSRPLPPFVRRHSTTNPPTLYRCLSPNLIPLLHISMDADRSPSIHS